MFSGLFQPMHLIVILVIVLIVWGPGKLPEIGEGLGKSIKAFKKAINDANSPKPANETASPTPLEHQTAQAATVIDIEGTPVSEPVERQEEKKG